MSDTDSHHSLRQHSVNKRLHTIGDLFSRRYVVLRDLKLMRNGGNGPGQVSARVSDEIASNVFNFPSAARSEFVCSNSGLLSEFCTPRLGKAFTLIAWLCDAEGRIIKDPDGVERWVNKLRFRPWQYDREAVELMEVLDSQRK